MPIPHRHLLIRVVELDGELGWQDGFWRGWDSAVLPDCVGRERGLGPVWVEEDFAVEDVVYVGVEEGGGIAVFGLRRRRVWVVQGVGGFEVVAAVGEVDGAVTVAFVVFLDIEGCWFR